MTRRLGDVRPGLIGRSEACALLVGFGVLLLMGPVAPRAHAATLDTHDVVLDPSGKLRSWVAPQDQAYGRVVSLSWGLLTTAIPIDSVSGVRCIYTNSEYQPDDFTGSTWPNNPAGKNAMLADAARLYYPYSGDARVRDLVKGLLDYQLANGTTPPSYAWANVPWSTAAGGSVTYGNDGLREGVGVLEPDKLGELGYHGYLTFYEWTGDTTYRDAAIHCADALASQARVGDATRSPWPFRVEAQTGAAVEEYCADVIGPIRLFDELIRLKLGNVADYQAARQMAWTWLMAYPMSNNVWVGYFEDVRVLGTLDNLSQYDAGQTARYLLEHPETDPSWQSHATHIINWITSNFGGTDNGEAGTQYGARVISEQFSYKYKMASHSSRWGAINALYAEATGDTVAKDKAFRTLNWCTYMCRLNGVVIEGPAENAHDPTCWYTDGHGDYTRHFMLAMAAFPEWAPANENHLLRSTSVVTSVNYSSFGISYVTFDTAAQEVLRLSTTPTNVFANGVALSRHTDLAEPGWTFDAVTGVLRVRHDSARQIDVRVNESLGAGAPHQELRALAASPNPSTGEVQLNFALPRAGEVDLIVCDMSGRLVRKIVTGNLASGSRDATWDGNDSNGRRVGAGVYFVRLRCAGSEQTARVVRMR